jgi:hypothetical protein
MMKVLHYIHSILKTFLKIVNLVRIDVQIDFATLVRAWPTASLKMTATQAER